MGRNVLPTAIALAALVLGGWAVRGGADARDATTRDHPLVGTWVVDVDMSDNREAFELYVFTADGAVADVGVDLEPVLGAWAATGDATADATIALYKRGEKIGDVVGSTMRLALKVSAGGDDFAAVYTWEFALPGPGSTGEAGPGTMRGTRLAVEGPGDPVMSLREAYAVLDGEDAGPPEM